jgi:hypothetical protein
MLFRGEQRRALIRGVMKSRHQYSAIQRWGKRRVPLLFTCRVLSSIHQSKMIYSANYCVKLGNNEFVGGIVPGLLRAKYTGKMSSDKVFGQQHPLMFPSTRL